VRGVLRRGASREFVEAIGAAAAEAVDVATGDLANDYIGLARLRAVGYGYRW